MLGVPDNSVIHDRCCIFNHPPARLTESVGQERTIQYGRAENTENAQTQSV
jgi:hypothetical protein